MKYEGIKCFCFALLKNEFMIAVIFEVEPAAEQLNEYLAVAAQLYDELKTVEGFISVERFKSLSDDQKLLSLSFWKDAESVANWRNAIQHRTAQVKGRASVFRNYRLRVANVIRDYGMGERDEAPVDSKQFHHS